MHVHDLTGQTRDKTGHNKVKILRIIKQTNKQKRLWACIWLSEVTTKSSLWLHYPVTEATPVWKDAHFYGILWHHQPRPVKWSSFPIFISTHNSVFAALPKWDRVKLECQFQMKYNLWKKTSCFDQSWSKIGAVVKYSCGISTRACHKHFTKTSGNRVNLFKKKKKCTVHFL